MSISPTLKAASRSAYRGMWRASSVTFAGDEPLLSAFRLKMRNDALAIQQITDPESYQQHIQLGREIADVLRRNVVQAVKVAESNEGKDTWRVRITKDTELGDNESVKIPPLETESSRSMRKRDRSQHTSFLDAALHELGSSESSPTSTPPLYYSALKKAHKQRTIPVLREEDLEESFVRGSGPGGQSINKTENNVQLLHKPTGIRVSCQETRSLTQNRKIARRIVLEKLDQIANPGLSKEGMQRAKQRERERRRRKKAKKKSQKGKDEVEEEEDE